MQSLSSIPSSSESLSSSLESSGFVRKSSEFLGNLVSQFGIEEKSHWRNNNSTLKERLYVIDMADLKETPAKIYRMLFAHNREAKERPLVAVPVAGWETEKKPWYVRWFPCIFGGARRQRLVKEYAQSFSLSDITTAKTADVALRVSKAAQKLEIYKKDGKYFLRVPAGARITDIDRYLLKKGFVLPPNMPTLNMASLVGAAANGCYGPGFGPMTDNIVEIKGFNALGEPITLSSKENSDLFAVLRDCHLGAFFVSEVTVANIQPKYLLKRKNVLMKDVEAFEKEMERSSWMKDDNPFIFMYIPVDIRDEGDHFPRMRVTTIGKTDKSTPKKPQSQDCRDFTDYLNLITTEAGEPLIDLIVESKELRQFFPFVLKTAAMKTFGFDKETLEVDWAPYMLHLFRTYTDLPIFDINWLIQVNSPEQARELLVELMKLTESKLKHYAEKDKYPLFNAFARYLKGIYYPEGEGGIAPTAVDHDHQSILSFEFLTYGGLADTKAFKSLIDDVVNLLHEKGFKFTYHPGKHWPENVRSLTQIFNDTIGRKRLENFQNAVYELHGGKENIPFSPTLTERKKEFIGFEPPADVCRKKERRGCTQKQKEEALKKIKQLAEEEGNEEIAARAAAKLR